MDMSHAYLFYYIHKKVKKNDYVHVHSLKQLQHTLKQMYEIWISICM